MLATAIMINWEIVLQDSHCHLHALPFLQHQPALQRKVLFALLFPVRAWGKEARPTDKAWSAFVPLAFFGAWDYAMLSFPY